MGTPFYLAPELFEGKPYSDKSDMWAIGVILYEMVSLRKPFTGLNLKDLEHKILTTKPLKVAGASRDICIVIMALLNKDPERRLSAQQLLDMPFIRSKAKSLAITLPKKKAIAPSTKAIQAAFADKLKKII